MAIIALTVCELIALRSAAFAGESKKIVVDAARCIFYRRSHGLTPRRSRSPTRTQL
jgi:hypothetical protein